MYQLTFPVIFQTSIVYGYNCFRGKCDFVETGDDTNLGWFGTEV